MPLPVGRQPLILKKPEIAQQIIEAIRVGNYIETAANYAGIGHSTFHLWMKKGRDEIERLVELEERGIDAEVDPALAVYVEFVGNVKKAEADAEVQAVTRVRSAMGENWQAAMTFLERKYPAKWGRRVDLNITETRPVLNIQMNQPDPELAEIMEQNMKLVQGEVIEHED